MTHDPTARERSHARYEALVLPHLDRLLGFARRRTATLADAEDAVQEACARAWLAFDELRDEALVRPWLYQILVSVLAAAAEKAGRRRRLVSVTRLEEAHEAVIGGAPDAVFEEVVARLTADAARQALDALPDDVAAPLELHVVEGLRYREVAAVLGIPIGTVMSRIHRGRKLLQGALASQVESGAAGSAGDVRPRRNAGTPHARPVRD